jgi:hypothetical protein
MVLVGKLYSIKLYNRCTIFFSFPRKYQARTELLEGTKGVAQVDGWTEVLEGTATAASKAVASEKRRYLSNNFVSCFPRTCQKNEGGVYDGISRKAY